MMNYLIVDERTLPSHIRKSHTTPMEKIFAEYSYNLIAKMNLVVLVCGGGEYFRIVKDRDVHVSYKDMFPIRTLGTVIAFHSAIENDTSIDHVDNYMGFLRRNAIKEEERIEVSIDKKIVEAIDKNFWELI